MSSYVLLLYSSKSNCDCVKWLKPYSKCWHQRYYILHCWIGSSHCGVWPLAGNTWCTTGPQQNQRYSNNQRRRQYFIHVHCRIWSFQLNDSREYICGATVSPKSPSPYITGIGSQTGMAIIGIGKCVDTLTMTALNLLLGKLWRDYCHKLQWIK